VVIADPVCVARPRIMIGIWRYCALHSEGACCNDARRRSKEITDIQWDANAGFKQASRELETREKENRTYREWETTMEWLCRGKAEAALCDWASIPKFSLTTTLQRPWSPPARYTLQPNFIVLSSKLSLLPGCKRGDCFSCPILLSVALAFQDPSLLSFPTRTLKPPCLTQINQALPEA